MIDPDTMERWHEADRRAATQPPRTEAQALEVRLRSLVGELEARVAVAVRAAVAPLVADVSAMRAEVDRLSSMHPTKEARS